MRTAAKLLLGSILLTALPARAHEPSERALGTVETIRSEALVIRTSDGHTVTFSVAPDTRFEREGKRVERTEVQPGERAVVQAKRAGDSMQATRVKLGAVKQGPRNTRR